MNNNFVNEPVVNILPELLFALAIWFYFDLKRRRPKKNNIENEELSAYNDGILDLRNIKIIIFMFLMFLICVVKYVRIFFYDGNFFSWLNG